MSRKVEALGTWAVVFTGLDGAQHVAATANEKSKLLAPNSQWSIARLIPAPDPKLARLDAAVLRKLSKFLASGGLLDGECDALLAA